MQTIYREKSLERISSPEQLTDYLRVTNPATWSILAAVITLLAGLLVWASCTPLETTVSVKAVVSDSHAEVRITQSPESTVSGSVSDWDPAAEFQGKILRIGSLETEIQFVRIDDDGAAFALAEAGTLADGDYAAQIVTERITPMQLLFDRAG